MPRGESFEPTFMLAHDPLRRERLAYSRDEAAVLVGLSLPKLDKEIRSRRLKAKQLGRRIVIPAKALEEWLANLPDV